MKAQVTLKNLDSESCKHVIVRNLNRILDLRIIDIDLESGILHFLYHGQNAFEQAKSELSRIGYPIQECRYKTPETKRSLVEYTNAELVL